MALGRAFSVLGRCRWSIPSLNTALMPSGSTAIRHGEAAQAAGETFHDGMLHLHLPKTPKRSRLTLAGLLGTGAFAAGVPPTSNHGDHVSIKQLRLLLCLRNIQSGDSNSCRN